MTARQYFDMVNSVLRSNLSGEDKVRLEVMRNHLITGITVMDDLMAKYTPGEGVPDRSEFEYINEQNKELWKVVIDELNSR